MNQKSNSLNLNQNQEQNQNQDQEYSSDLTAKVQTEMLEPLARQRLIENQQIETQRQNNIMLGNTYPQVQIDPSNYKNQSANSSGATPDDLHNIELDSIQGTNNINTNINNRKVSKYNQKINDVGQTQQTQDPRKVQNIKPSSIGASQIISNGIVQQSNPLSINNNQNLSPNNNESNFATPV